MEMMDSFSLVIGILAVGIGFYELLTKSLVGRDAYRPKKEQVKKFLPYDAGTYIIAGALLAMTGAGDYFPFVRSGWFIISSIAVSLTVIILNVHFTRKILGVPDTSRKL